MSDIKLISTSTTLQEQFGGTLVLRAQPAGTSYGPQTDSQAAPELTFDLLPAAQGTIPPRVLHPRPWRGPQQKGGCCRARV